MREFLCFMCGVAEMAAIGAILSLGLSQGVAVVLLLIPVVLLVLSLVVPAWARAARARRAGVFVYVPFEQRRYPGEVSRLSGEEEQWYQP